MKWKITPDSDAFSKIFGKQTKFEIWNSLIIIADWVSRFTAFIDQIKHTQRKTRITQWKHRNPHNWTQKSRTPFLFFTTERGDHPPQPGMKCCLRHKNPAWGTWLLPVHSASFMNHVMLVKKSNVYIAKFLLRGVFSWPAAVWRLTIPDSLRSEFSHNIFFLE